MTEEETAKCYAEWHKEGELSDDELDNVSGGCRAIGVPLTEDVFGSDLSKCLFFEGHYWQKLDSVLAGYCSAYKQIFEKEIIQNVSDSVLESGKFYEFKISSSILAGSRLS